LLSECHMVEELALLFGDDQRLGQLRAGPRALHQFYVPSRDCDHAMRAGSFILR
jgi:hypothetical protein